MFKNSDKPYIALLDELGFGRGCIQTLSMCPILKFTRVGNSEAELWLPDRTAKGKV